jgi:hypothetical protein
MYKDAIISAKAINREKQVLLSRFRVGSRADQPKEAVAEAFGYASQAGV